MNFNYLKDTEKGKAIYQSEEGYLIEQPKCEFKRGNIYRMFGQANRHMLNHNIPIWLIKHNKTAKFKRWYIGKDNKVIIEMICECGKLFVMLLSDFAESRAIDRAFKCKKCIQENKTKPSNVINEFHKLGYLVLTPREEIKRKSKILIQSNEGYKGYILYDNVILKKQNISWFHYNTAKEFLVDNINIHLQSIGVKSRCINARGVHEPMDMICECGREYSAIRSVIMKGESARRCPFCTNSISEIELKVKEYLQELNVQFEQQKTFDGLKDIYPLHFDFYITSKNTVIEVQGEQHYKPVSRYGGEKEYQDRIKKDNIKRKYCDDNGIQLIEIKYNEFKNDSYKSKIEMIF